MIDTKLLNDKIEFIAEEVHNSWWKEKIKQGFHSPNGCKSDNHKSYLKADWQAQDRFDDNTSPKFYKWCDKCHTDMYSYGELAENIKDYDRVTVKTVIDAIEELNLEES